VDRKLIAALSLAAAFHPLAAWAHGVVGQRTFIEPIVAEDANPKNEFVIARPSWTRTAEGRQFSLAFSLEKKISENGSITVGSAWLADSPKDSDEPYASGFADLELAYKYAFLTMPEHEFRLSGALVLALPTGNRNVGEDTHTRLGPELLWAWGFGDIPNEGPWKYLRPFAIQGNFLYLTKTSGHANDAIEAANVLEYSAPYLSSFVRDVGLPWPLRNLIPFVEIDYEQIVNGRTNTTFPDIRLTPGVAYMDNWIEVAAATQFAVNNATIPENHAAVLGLVDLFIDNLIPASNWTPF
jgi:hypothetical protein